ncbi:MAG TPA: hypothetical protein VG228_04540 [Solirubrobacteraceae bacterium]|nr:hypothetical protein [Solirubrobacteraceae bacterium]
MTGIEVDVETQAQRIAARGRQALVERLRTAYGDAAAAHADLISLDDERIEAMVQSAADNADGLQWRRALARVASDELGLSVPEALSHPAVARAQELIGAPSYEQSLAEMIARPVPLPAPPEPEPGPAAVQAEPIAQAPEVAGGEESSDELETVQADDVVLELLPEPDPEPDPIDYETEPYGVEASFAEDSVPPAPANPFAAHAAQRADEQQEADDYAPETAQYTAAAALADDEPVGQISEPVQEEEETEVIVAAVHLGGVANLPTKREGLSVRLSADGLDIMQGPRDIIGRLVWDEIEALEVPNLRARRRSKQVRARLVVRTPHGDASFEVPDVEADELRERVAPLMALYGRH